MNSSIARNWNKMWSFWTAFWTVFIALIFGMKFGMEREEIGARLTLRKLLSYAILVRISPTIFQRSPAHTCNTGQLIGSIRGVYSGDVGFITRQAAGVSAAVWSFGSLRFPGR